VKAVKFQSMRPRCVWFVNPDHVLSFYACDPRMGDGGRTAIEVLGNQGYRNHVIYVPESPDEVARMLDTGAQGGVA
jgi:hypothetical protein